MSHSFEKLRTRQLDRTFEKLEPLGEVDRPPRGWLRAVREALGMTMGQAAGRLGVTKSMISKYEKGEVEGTITLATLRRVARALDSEVVYAVVPAGSIEAIRHRRACAVARQRVEAVHQSMTLEGQAISEKERRQEIFDLAEELLAEHPRALWREV